MLRRSLLESGTEINPFELTKVANSREQWAEMAKSLEANKCYAEASKAYLTAGDSVRSWAADAWQLLTNAAEKKVAGLLRRGLLATAAAQLLAAVSRAAESPIPVTPKQLRRWTLLAAKCMSDAGGHCTLPAVALYLRLRKYNALKMVLKDVKDGRLRAELCLAAEHSLASASDSSSKEAAGAVPQPRGGIPATAADDGDEGKEAQQQQQAAKEVARRRSWLGMAAHAWYEGGDVMASLRVLNRIGVVADIIASTGGAWPALGKAAPRMAREAHVRLQGRIRENSTPHSRPTKSWVHGRYWLLA